jgi:hypothetical protein
MGDERVAQVGLEPDGDDSRGDAEARRGENERKEEEGHSGEWRSRG